MLFFSICFFCCFGTNDGMDRTGLDGISDGIGWKGMGLVMITDWEDHHHHEDLISSREGKGKKDVCVSVCVIDWEKMVLVVVDMNSRQHLGAVGWFMTTIRGSW